ncbi:DUF6282 family protein [Acidaminococcus sp. NSJ-142]|jgi:hypothetical protein|uniref:DUF6282 family protein n=1 Tax=Acidaminococcus TaxID=904 RepID=UPI000E5092DC|nr:MULTISPECIES: DUF6282 family protein [Acidaminococcus]MCD2434531.1 DUF6282 family protein [Acidaminococcus hominis]RHK03810.1 hypothetical protein DW089_00650 [Acidaminococcus sp. AM05-11]
MESISLAAYGLLKGGYDLHIHSLPSALDRQLDDIQVFKEADRAEMAGILLKNHGEPTGSRAWLLNRYLPLAKVKAYGAAVLNWSLGGLNPLAVQTALALGARIIFMPTVDAANFPLRNLPGDVLPRPGIRITDPDGNLRQEVRAIFQVVKVKGALLATGHISPEEALLLCREGRKEGVRMVLTHPEWAHTRIRPQDQAELAQSGVYIEKCWYNVAEGECTPAEMAEHIRLIGPEHCFLTTDRGQNGRETPVEGMLQFIQSLLDEGISQAAIRTMVTQVPEEMLGIE